MPLVFHMLMIAMSKKYYDIMIGSPLLFVRGTARVKIIRIERDIDRKPLTFCTWRCMCKMYKDRIGRRSGAHYFLYVVLRV
jgi:hypothetical protein